MFLSQLWMFHEIKLHLLFFLYLLISFHNPNIEVLFCLDFEDFDYFFRIIDDFFSIFAVRPVRF